MNITDKKIIEFSERGFTQFERALEIGEIDEIKQTVEAILANPAFDKDLLSIDSSKNTHKILYPLDKDTRLLKYIVHPKILDVLLKLIDDPTQIVLTWEDILIKEAHHGVPVGYHQDLALQSTDYDIFSFGIYLHDSKLNPVYYLPESFKYGALTKDELYRVVEAHKQDFVPLLLDAGDISLHNVKSIHYSDMNVSSQPRYTWYLEYRTMHQLRENSPWDEQWILERRAIFVAALLRYAPEYVEQLAPDLAELQPYLDHLNLRVSHTNDKVQYDMQSPYNHFS